MAKGYGLRLFSSVLQGRAFVGDISDIAVNWRRSTRMQGGFWQGSFQVSAPVADLFQWFYDFLGYHLEEQMAGMISWEGMIYALELSYAGVRRRRTLEKLANAVVVRYTDASTDSVTATAYSTQDQSIARYGRREEGVTLGKATAAAAAAQRDSYLKENAWPWPRPVSASQTAAGGKATLDVRVCGYAFTLNWKFVGASSAPGTTSDVSALISSILTDYSEFVTQFDIRSNTLQVRRTTALDKRAWDLLQGLTALGDASGNPWQLLVEAGRRAVYQPIDVLPRYYLLRGGLYTSVGEGLAAAPWLVRPAVVRDMQYPSSVSEPGSFLTDARDMLVEEVEVDGTGKLSFKTNIFSEAALLDAQGKEQQDV